MREFAEFESDADVREILKGNGIFEAHRLIAEYRCYRTRKDGGTQDVLVRIFDVGAGNPRARYSWNVSVPDANESGSVPANPADSIMAAGHEPHWTLLETDARKGKG
ncbi:hypothetical protein [Engelhardtia mirabilis]|uniref:Uncharacterized protein n=1 Tax=Engelhardtia mirabilis TaxID=2528011 RepID=A0A518BT47_9BACT|nr:hypothetical protein Pla133_52710 [Planctomycetes bacterium Pla133]QDV04475.1 hypothetical protein Pla86_52710 [Planctomycetes bacterium Pla86]